MNKVLKLAAGMALSAGVGLMPASAVAFVSWSFDSGCSNSGAPRGNTCTFSNAEGNVTASAWANTGPGLTLETATLVRFGGGLGVLNENDPNVDPNHTIDNTDDIDVVLFDFSDLDPDKFELTGVRMGYIGSDSDVSILAYTGADPFDVNTNLNNVAYTSAGMTAAGWTVVGNYDTNGFNVQPVNEGLPPVTSSYWLVGAWNPSFGACSPGAGICQNGASGYPDQVKLDLIKGELRSPPPGTPPNSVPEPGSLLLLVGSLLPLAWRRRLAGSAA